MHELLSLDQRVRRARRRLGEVAAWRVRETKAIGGSVRGGRKSSVSTS